MKAADAGFDEYSLFHAWHTEDKGSRFADPTLEENGELLRELKGEYGPDHWVHFVNDFITRKKGATPSSIRPDTGQFRLVPKSPHL